MASKDQKAAAKEHRAARKELVDHCKNVTDEDATTRRLNAAVHVAEARMSKLQKLGAYLTPPN